MDAKQLLEQFLNFPITSSDEIISFFGQLPGAVSKKGAHPLEQFVYVPGSRKDRVLLVAHADTVWHSFYGNPQSAQLKYGNGVFSSGSEVCGIGADDRAGCAMVWALRNSGHSLLIVDGEEKGKYGARYLRKCHRKLFREINRHRFMLEMDWAGTNGCLYNQVDNSDAFKSYILNQTGFSDSMKKGGCDLQILCKKICGVNMATGWHFCHSPRETLVVSEWENTYNILKDFLAKSHPRFPIPLKYRARHFLRACKALLGRILRKLKLLPVK